MGNFSAKRSQVIAICTVLQAVCLGLSIFLAARGFSLKFKQGWNCSPKELTGLHDDIANLHSEFQTLLTGDRPWDHTCWEPIRDLLQRYADAIYQVGHYDQELLTDRHLNVSLLTTRQGYKLITNLQDFLRYWDMFLGMFRSVVVYFDLAGNEHSAFGLKQDATISIIEIAGPVHPAGEPPKPSFVSYLSKLMADSLDYCIPLQFSRYLFHQDRNIYWMSVGAVNDMRRLRHFFGPTDIEHHLAEATEVWRSVGFLQYLGLIKKHPEWKKHRREEEIGPAHANISMKSIAGRWGLRDPKQTTERMWETNVLPLNNDRPNNNVRSNF